jgi:hypothetical protein
VADSPRDRDLDSHLRGGAGDCPVAEVESPTLAVVTAQAWLESTPRMRRLNALDTAVDEDRVGPDSLHALAGFGPAGLNAAAESAPVTRSRILWLGLVMRVDSSACLDSDIKTYAIYPEPFWRKDGLNGQAASDVGPGG